MKWPLVAFKSIATIERTILRADQIARGTAYVGLDAIPTRGGSVRPVTLVNGQLQSSKFRFQPGHILYGKLRPYLAKVAFVDFAGVCSTDILPLRPGPSVDGSYLRYFLLHPDTVAKAASLAIGANLPRLSPSVLETFLVPLPPLDEQRRIADILDTSANLRARRQLAVALIETVGRAIFTDMFGEGSELHLRWPTLRVSEVGRVQLGRQRAPKFQTGQFTTPYVRVANVFEDRLDLTDVLSMDFDRSDRTSYLLDEGDILLTEGQSTELVGRPAMWRGELPGCCFQNTLLRFQADRQRVSPDYALGLFLQYFRSGQFARTSNKTSNVAHLGAARFAAMPFPLPPRTLQDQYGTRLQHVRSAAITMAHSNNLFNELTESLHKRAFRGEL